MLQIETDWTQKPVDHDQPSHNDQAPPYRY